MALNKSNCWKGKLKLVIIAWASGVAADSVNTDVTESDAQFVDSRQARIIEFW